MMKPEWRNSVNSLLQSSLWGDYLANRSDDQVEMKTKY